jgi:hypothetical protein
MQKEKVRILLSPRCYGQSAAFFLKSNRQKIILVGGVDHRDQLHAILYDYELGVEEPAVQRIYSFQLINHFSPAFTFNNLIFMFGGKTTHCHPALFTIGF